MKVSQSWLWAFVLVSLASAGCNSAPAAGGSPGGSAGTGAAAAGSNAAGSDAAGASGGGVVAGGSVAGASGGAGGAGSQPDDGADAGLSNDASVGDRGQPGNYTVDPKGNQNRNPGFVDLSPPMGEPLPDTGDSVSTTPPAGWVWHTIAGTQCRDGSPNGLYVHKGTANKLVIYLEGGGACSNNHYCAFNPASVDQVLAGDGQVVIGSTLGTGAGRQQPGVYTDGNHAGPPNGIFDTSNSANPFKDWSQVYVPYCTGDVHFGTKPNGMVPNLSTPQQFVGYTNMQKFIGRIVPTFKSVERVILTGSSAGGFGSALNFSMVQDAFGDVPVDVIDDSGPPFNDKFMPVCMQKRWREAWGLNAALPPDCTECFQADGGGLIRLADFLLRKHPKAHIAMVSSVNDEVIRLFYSVGLTDCSAYDTADPVVTVLTQFDATKFFPAQQYADGLADLRTTYVKTGRYSTYYLGGANITYHEHIFRPRFYDAAAGTETVAAFISGFLSGKLEQIGP